jgi:hypothetical protein
MSYSTVPYQTDTKVLAFTQPVILADVSGQEHVEAVSGGT